jgi:hypothetical protein
VVGGEVVTTGACVVVGAVESPADGQFLVLKSFRIAVQRLCWLGGRVHVATEALPSSAYE